MIFENYQQAEDFLFLALPNFAKEGRKAYKPGLERIKELCEALGNPQNDFKTIHIGGTNGKGSVSNILFATFIKHGLKTGVYNSPHLIHYRERIKINGDWIEEQFILDFLNKTYTIIQDIQPSFFEVTVAMAFAYFSFRKVDVVVLEVGLGGIFDSTNIVNPILSIITNISIEHTNILGNTIAEIATSKAGIIKQNVPVIIGEKNEEAMPIFIQKAKDSHSELVCAADLLTIQKATIVENKQSIIYIKNDKQEIVIESDLIGVFQQKNIRTAYTAIKILEKEFQGLEKSFLDASKNISAITGFSGRWQTVSNNPKTIVDVCHNEAGVLEAMANLKNENYKTIHILLGLSADKEIEKIVTLLPPYAIYYFTQANSSRALHYEEFDLLAQKYNLKGEIYSTIALAHTKIKKQSSSDDLVLIMGSCYLVGEFLNLIEFQPKILV